MKRFSLRRLGAGAAALLAVADLATPALAATACFRRADIEADQAIRFETRLMVLSDTCGVDAYRAFAVRNNAAIRGYERTMTEHFRRAGARSPTSSFDTWETELANKAALAESREPAAVVCQRSSEFLTTAQRLDTATFRHRVMQLADTKADQYRKCPR